MQFDKSEIKRIVAEQICNMIDNNIVRGYGNESFVGWLEDGDIFFNVPDDDTPPTEEEVSEIMDFVHSIADLVDNLTWRLDPQNDD